MKGGSLAAKINSIEAQLEILKFSNSGGILPKGKAGLSILKGFLKGKVNFSEADLEEARIKFKEKL